MGRSVSGVAQTAIQELVLEKHATVRRNRKRGTHAHTAKGAPSRANQVQQSNGNELE